MIKSIAKWNALLLRLRRWVLVFVAFSVAITIADLIAAFQFRGESTTRYMERYVISPLPPSMVHVKTFDLFRPTLGDGHCCVAYELTPTDLDNILHKGKLPLQKDIGFSSEEMDMQKKFHETWPNEKGPLESYILGTHADEGQLGTVKIVTSADHARAIFFVSDL